MLRSTILVGAAALHAIAPAHADDFATLRSTHECHQYLIIRLDQILSVDERNSPFNIVLTYDTHTDCYFCYEYSEVGWDVRLTAFQPSWLSDLQVGLGGVLYLRPGVFRDEPGGPERFFSDSNGNGQPDRYRLAPLGLPNVRSDADGFIRFEFSESFDDFPGVADGMWESGVIVLYGGVLTPTPCPGDIDINCEVGFSDLTSVLKWWGVSGPGIPGDTNGDQHINLLDVSIIFANWGLKCGPQLVNVQRVPRERSGPRPRREDEALGADTTVPPFFTVVE